MQSIAPSIRSSIAGSFAGALRPPSLGLYFYRNAYSMGAIGSLPSDRSFSDLITYTRAGDGGRFDSSGLFEMVGPNVPRFDYDPVTLQSRGLLSEQARTRLNSVCTGPTLLSPTRATYVDDGAIFIDGVTPFKKLVEDGSSGTHIGVPATVSISPGTAYTAQYVVEAAGRTKFQLAATSAASWAPSNPIVNYDLVAKTAVGANGASGTIKDIGSGRFLVTWTATSGAGAFSSAIYMFLRDAAGNTTYTGDGVSGIYVSGYQITAGSLATSLILGDGSPVTRSADSAPIVTLSPWYNPAEGFWRVTAEGIVGQPLLTAGSLQIVADSAALKTYDLAYSVDPVASSVVLGLGHIRSIQYWPRANV